MATWGDRQRLVEALRADHWPCFRGRCDYDHEAQADRIMQRASSRRPPHTWEVEPDTERGSGTNLLRNATAAQPRALRPGDVLANGDVVDQWPVDGPNGSVHVSLAHGQPTMESTVILVAARLPLALKEVKPL